MSDERIPAHQAAALLVPGIATAALFLPRSAIELAGRDAWLAPLIIAFYAGLIILTVIALYARFPGKTPVGIAAALFGVPGRIVVGLLYTTYGLHALAISAYQMEEFFTFAMLTRTPTFVLSGVMLGVAAFAVRGGVEVFARLAPAGVAVISAAVLAAGLLTIQDQQPSRLLPLLTAPLDGLLRAAAVMAAFYGEVVLLAWYLPHLSRSDKALRWFCAGLGLVTLLLMLLFAPVLAVFGPEVAQNLTAPVLSLVREARLGEFLDRLDVLFLSVWQLAFFFKLVFLLYPTAASLAEALNLRDARSLVPPLVILATLLSSLLFENIRQAAAFAGGAMVPYAAIYELLIPLLLLLFAGLRNRVHRGPYRAGEPQKERNPHMEGDGRQREGRGEKVEQLREVAKDEQRQFTQ